MSVLASPEAVAVAGAELVAACARAAVAASGRFAVALAGGNTPRRLHAVLARPPWRDEIDWARAELFWGDERAVLPDHPDSNFRMARETLLAPLGIPDARTHRMPAERADRDGAARAYQAELARALGVPEDGPPPRLDLVLLGMGVDGHTASLFPHTAALGERRRWVVANHVPQLATERLTLTYPMLDAAACVAFLVTGAEKAARLAEVMDGPPDPLRLPAQAVAPASGRLVWLVDRAAAGRLGGAPGR